MRQPFIAMLIAIVGVGFSSLSAAADEPMKFEVVTTDIKCGPCTTVFATGEITPETPAAFDKVVATQFLMSGTTVVLNSPGGSLMAGIELGRHFRMLGLYTSIYPRAGADSGEAVICASACAYMFFGGLERTADSNARLGLHQFAATERLPDAVATTQSVMAYVSAYLQEMRAPQSVLQLASSVPSSEMRWYSAELMLMLGMTTKGGTAVKPEWTLNTQMRRFEHLETQAVQADGVLVSGRINCPDHSRPSQWRYTQPPPYDPMYDDYQFSLSWRIPREALTANERIALKELRSISLKHDADPQSLRTFKASASYDNSSRDTLYLHFSVPVEDATQLAKSNATTFRMTWATPLIGRSDALLANANLASRLADLALECKARE